MLERPSLQAKCMGFAALKLCVDENGLQPMPDLDHEQVFLNAGQYLLPIVFGSVPTDNVFTEAIMDKLPHIHNAFLKVRLYDPNVEAAGKAGNLARVGVSTPISSPASEGAVFLNQSSIASILVNAHPFVSAVPKLPISETIIDEIQKGVAIDAGEKKVVLRQLSEWIVHAFPNIKQKIGVIDPRFIINYEDGAGTLVALDMLYNMPDRLKLIGAARSMKKRMLRKKTWDTKVNCFKTFFRYLPGAAPNRRPTYQDQIELIIDDASLDLDVTSRELCPAYLDEFSRTAGIELSINACVLVIVTAVDVLADSTATTRKPTAYFKPTTRKHPSNSSAYQKPHHAETGTDAPTSTSLSEEEDRLGQKARQEKEFKLRGLVGMYCAHEDPAATWWGLVPLMTDNPFVAPKHAGDRGASPLKGSPPQKNARKGDASAGGDAHSVVNSAAIYFVDAGTHQVPLFQGLPPEEMMTAPSPMAWLQGSLRAQILEQHVREGNGGCCGGAEQDVVSQKSGPPRPIVLSSGASAFVSVVDPRLKRFSDESVARDPSVPVKEESLRRLLKIACASQPKKGQAIESKLVNVDAGKYNKLYASFQYGPVNDKRIPHRSVEDALPHNVFHDSLVREMNELFLHTITS